MVAVILYEWLDEYGENDGDPLLFDLLSTTDGFFTFPDAIWTMWFNEEAELLMKDFEEDE